MAYTPELSHQGSATLRRLAWFQRKPMTKTLEALLEVTGRTMAEIKPGEVCGKCKDDSACDECAFHPPAKINSSIKSSKLIKSRKAPLTKSV